MKVLDIFGKVGIKKARNDYESKELQEIKKKAVEVANILWNEIETVQRKIEVQEHEIDRTKTRIEILGRKRATLLHLYLLLAEELFVLREYTIRLEEIQRKLKELEKDYVHELEKLQETMTKIENTDFSKGMESIDPELLELANVSTEEFKEIDELSSKLDELSSKLKEILGKKER